jgi:acyl dehydratase
VRTFHGIDDVEAAVGQQLGTSEWHRIDQRRIDEFSAVTGDHQWIHTDPLRAASTPFGSTIAHGYLTLALTTAFANEIYRIDDVDMLVNYGLNRVRFTAPVPVDSDLRGTIVLHSVERTGPSARVTLNVTVERQGSADPVCVGDMLIFVRE